MNQFLDVDAENMVLHFLRFWSAIAPFLIDSTISSCNVFFMIKHRKPLPKSWYILSKYSLSKSICNTINGLMNDPMLACRFLRYWLKCLRESKSCFFISRESTVCQPTNISNSNRWVLLPNENYALNMRAKLLQMCQNNFCCRVLSNPKTP